MLKMLLKPQASMTSLADEYGCSVSYISHVVAGRMPASAKFKLFCSNKFGLPVSVLFPEKGDQDAE